MVRHAVHRRGHRLVQDRISGFTDTGVQQPAACERVVGGLATTRGDGSKWNFAWAAHAGLAYQVSPNVTLELAYSYVDLGSGTTGTVTTFDGATKGNVKFKTSPRTT